MFIWIGEKEHVVHPRSVVGPRVFKNFINKMDLHRQSTSSARHWRWNRSRRRSWHNQRVVLPFWGTSKGTRETLKSGKGKSSAPPLGRSNLQHARHWSAEEDLRFLVNIRLTLSHQYAIMPQAASSILGCASRNIASRVREVILPLCSALVRSQPHQSCSGLPYVFPSWLDQAISRGVCQPQWFCDLFQESRHCFLVTRYKQLSKLLLGIKKYFKKPPAR